MGTRIRPCSPDDATALAFIGAATFLETFAGILEGDAIVAHCARQHVPEAYRSWLDAGALAWLGLCDPGGAPVGYALVTAPDLEAARPGDLELKRIYSFSRCHGSGLGRALMAAAIEGARQRDARRLLLGVYQHNARALAFYRRHGFCPVGTRRFDVGGRLYDDAVLALDL